MPAVRSWKNETQIKLIQFWVYVCACLGMYPWILASFNSFVSVLYAYNRCIHVLWIFEYFMAAMLGLP